MVFLLFPFPPGFFPGLAFLDGFFLDNALCPFLANLSFIRVVSSSAHPFASLVSMPSMNTVFPVAAMHEEMDDRAQEKESPRQDVRSIGLVSLPEEQGGARRESEQRYPSIVPHRCSLRSSGRKNHSTVGTPTMTTTQNNITQPIRLLPSPFPLPLRCVKEKAQGMPMKGLCISFVDQPFGPKMNLPRKTNRGLSCKMVQTILDARSSRLIPHRQRNCQPVGIQPES